MSKVLLIVMDGWGYREDPKDNAILEADTPYYDNLWNSCPHSLLSASGESVGLPGGQIGNSEIGHMTIGAGRIIDTDLVRITKVGQAGKFKTNPAFVTLFDHVKNNNSALHVCGLIGPGGVHSHTDHLMFFLNAAKEAGATNLVLHAFLDGRDTPPQSASEYLKVVEDKLAELGIGFVATVIGRYYAMDRDHNWDRLARAEAAMLEGKADRIYQNRKPSEIMEELYRDGVKDELLPPVVIQDSEGKASTILPNDGIFFFNFRADRARMLSQHFIEKQQERNWCFTTMTEYDKNFNCLVAFPPERPETTIAKEVSKAGLSQAHIAETEKYAHATYFLNGGVEQPYGNENDILIDSRKDVATHDQAPKMRAEEITDAALGEVEAGKDFIFINYANADMVGHTANHDAIITAIEEVDAQLSRIVESAKPHGYTILVTADHGNAEINIDQETGKLHTAHTTSPVPFIVVGKGGSAHDGTLADIAPTVLQLMGLSIPESMTGKSLIE